MHTTLTRLVTGPTQGFSVDRDRGHRTGEAGEPGADRGVQEITINGLQSTPQRGFVRSLVTTMVAIPPCPQRLQDVLGCIPGPFADRGEGPGAGQDRGRGDEQDRHEGVPHSTTRTGIRHTDEMFSQVTQLSRPIGRHTGCVVRMGQLMQGGRDRRRCSSRHGSLT
jgi:hypothetical protein